MIVGHVYKQPILQFSPTRVDVVETQSGRVVNKTPPKQLRFKPIDPGIPTNKLPTRYGSGRLKSTIDTTIEAERLGIPENELIDWIKAHKSYGLHMIVVDEESTQAVGDEGFGDGIVANGDGSFTCTLCENKFLRDERGLPGHRGSKAHQAALERARAGLLTATA